MTSLITDPYWSYDSCITIRTYVARCYETSTFISFLDYWQVTLIWSPYGDASRICSFTYWWHVHHLLYWRGHLESRWLFTNTCSFLAVTWTSWISSTSPLLIYSSAWLVPRHALLISLLSSVTQSCALLYIAVHCDLLLQWRYCSCDAYCSRYLIVLLRYISQVCWVPCSPRLDFFLVLQLVHR